MDVSDLLSRRRFAASLAGIVLAPAIVTSKNRVEVAGCMLTPEVTEGPYYVDDTLIRHEISESRPGVPLQLEIVVVDGRQCKAVPYAAVSVWHCDGSGVYSGYTAQSPNGPPGMPPGAHGRPPGPPPFRPGDDQGPPSGPPHHGPSDETRFFRGVQVAGTAGQVNFSTIYPGWYMGRDTHIHLKIHTGGRATSGKYVGGHVCHTGQLFFPDELSDSVARLKPYSSHKLDRTRQQEDDVFLSQDSTGSMLALAQINPRDMAEGFRTRIVVGVDPDAEPGPVGFGGPSPRNR